MVTIKILNFGCYISVSQPLAIVLFVFLFLRLLRASKYVGCGDAVQTKGGRMTCRVQVCRYIRAGNCAMGSFDDDEGDNWLVPMLMGEQF